MLKRNEQPGRWVDRPDGKTILPTEDLELLSEYGLEWKACAEARRIAGRWRVAGADKDDAQPEGGQ